MDPEARFSSEKLTPDPRYVRTINGRNFVTYPGLLELASQAGLSSLSVEILQYPTEQNRNTAVCKATAAKADGRSSIDIGEASPETLDPRVAKFALSMASTRAKARALRNLCGIGMTCLEELGSIEEVILADPENSVHYFESSTANSISNSTANSISNHSPTHSETTPDSHSSTSLNNVHHFPSSSSASGTSTPATEAQLRAINAIAKRRKLSGVELANFCRTATSKSLDELSKIDASRLIDSLKQAA